MTDAGHIPYDLRAYGQMINDPVRMEAYAEALRRSIEPGDIVVDIGTGPGVMAILACRFGASRVYAIEPNDAIEVGRAAADAMNLSDQIEFMQKVSTEVVLDGRAEVVVSDLRGVLPVMEGNIEAIVDARQRFLAPGGTLIPLRDRLMVAPLAAPDLYRDLLEPWERNEFGLDLTAGRDLVRNAWKRARPLPDQLIAEPREWAEIDYATVADPAIAGEASWTIAANTLMHGFAVWFETELIEGVGFSTGPNDRPTVYGSAFFPMAHPLDAAAGDSLRVKLRAGMVGGVYVWSWDTTIEGTVNQTYRQSTFQGVPRSSEALLARSADYVPDLSEEGAVTLRILTYLAEGTMTNRDIAAAIAKEFPERFRDSNSALGKVGDVVLEYRS